MSQADVVRTYILWSQNGQVVSSADLAEALPHSVESIHKFLHHPKVQAYLVNKHNLLPPPKYKSRRTLTDEQRTWLGIITDPYSQRSLNTMVKANEEWMSMEKHRRWMKQPAFHDEYQRMLAGELKGTEGEAIRRNATKAIMGDVKALEMHYRLKGEPLPNALAPAGQGGIPVDLVMQLLQRICTSEQLTQFALLLQNPDAPLQLTQHSADPYPGADEFLDADTGDDSVTGTEERAGQIAEPIDYRGEMR